MSGHHHGHGCGHDHSGETKKTVILNLIVNLTLLAAKWVAYFLTGSPSLFGEACHSAADSANPAFLWIGYRRGRRPQDADHPFGHGRETFFWSIIAALVMLVVGSFLTAYHGIETIVSGEAPDYSPWSLGIMAFALLAEGYTVTLAFRRLLKEQGQGIFGRIRGSRNTVLLGVLLENAVDASGVLLAFTGFGLYLLTGNPLWDAGFSLAIAALLATSSLFLINKSRSLLMGEAVSPETVEAVRRAVLTRPAVAEITGLKAVTLDSEDFRCHVTVRLESRWFCDAAQVRDWHCYHQPIRWTLEQVTAEVAAIRAAVIASVPHAAEVDVELV